MGDLYRGCRSANCLQSNQTKPFTHIFLECLPYLNWEDFEVFLGGIYMYLGCQSMARLQSNKTKPFKPFTSLKRIGKTSRCFYGGFLSGLPVRGPPGVKPRSGRRAVVDVTRKSISCKNSKNTKNNSETDLL